ncbi:MAG TPA: hypothetical protein VEB69_08475 [Acidimicrobiia bacterium]|nr:hypothetical protein [Acidimicrobiia bacterium]
MASTGCGRPEIPTTAAVEWVDTRSQRGCSPAARWTAVTTNALYHGVDKLLYADFTDIRCGGRSEMLAVDGIHMEFRLLEDNGSLMEISDTSAVYGHI